MNKWSKVFVIASISLFGVASTMADESGLISAGREIYLRGQLPSGALVTGIRSNNESINGQAAACVNCHRGSGLGGAEGNVLIPPISGHALFGGAQPVVVRQDRRFNNTLSEQHPPYTEQSFALAIREGQNANGRSMGPLMPRFKLSDSELHALTAYLRTLSTNWSPGAMLDEVRVATVITPDVDPERRQAFLITLNTLLAQINMNAHVGARQKISVNERRFSTRRKLNLSVWELDGSASTWPAQLRKLQETNPVFAVLSGLGALEWQPVQDFCDAQRVVCWFPSIDLIPSNGRTNHFGLYFSDGVITEAQVLASKLKDSSQRVVQIVGADPLASAAANVLRNSLPKTTPLEDVILATAQPLPKSRAGDVVVAWLRSEEYWVLHDPAVMPSTVYVSARLVNEEVAPLLGALSERAVLVQTLEIPKIRNANLMRFDAWAEGSHVPLVDRKMQSEVYFAVRSFVSIERSLLNNLQTEYMIERAESSLSMFEASQVQEEVQSLMMAPVNKRPVTLQEMALIDPQTSKAQYDNLLKRGGTTMYPRLSLAPGQRVASKGAYLIELNASKLNADPIWVTP